MKRIYVLFVAVVGLLAACTPPPAQTISGIYTGTYTNGAMVSLNGTAEITMSSDKVVNITLTAATMPTVNITGVNIVTESNGTYTLVKTDITGALSGAVTNNATDLSISYASISGAIAFDGSK